MNSWKAEGKPQVKPKKRLKKLKQWNKANKQLAAKLKTGLNQGPQGSFYLYSNLANCLSSL
jgi:hypothetical protein